MSMIERAARALAEAQSGVDVYDALDEGMQETLKENVRAVIEAMRKPSEGMVLNGAGRLWAGSGNLADEQATETYQLMIDAALAED